MTYPDAIEFLYDLRWFGLKLGLENTFKLVALVGNPQNKLRFIHVAGTNGKGSTCAMLESIYRAAGLRVGLFTSPHLVSFRERIQVNRQLISEADVVRLVQKLRESLEFRVQSVSQPAEAGTSNKEADRHEACPTFFEFVTVLALKYFAEQKCDLVVWETGLGGRLDATNIVTPLASVITNISFDHEKWLGHTLAEIAREKAGIIKRGVPVLTATDAPEALAVIEETAVRLNAPLTAIRSQEPTPSPSEGGERCVMHARCIVPLLGGVSGRFPVDFGLPLLGDHQRINAALAVATVRALLHKIQVSEEAIRHGLETVEWPGRLQVVKRDNQTLILDGAHNPAGVETLRAGLEKYFPDQRTTMILGCLADKDWPTMCQTLAPLADQIFLAPVQSMRTAAPADLAEVCQRTNPAARVEACATLAHALQRTAAIPFVVITGSLHFIGEAMELLQVSATTAQDERGLNEWQLAPAPQHGLR